MKPTFSKTASTRAHSTSRPNQSIPIPAQKTAASPSPDIARSGKRILLVDDDATVRDSLGNVLATNGYVVIPAENGVQALHLVNQVAFDLVLLDLNMPLQNGWETLERLNTENPLIPIVIITARANQVFTALSAGAAALLEKPLDIPKLFDALERLLAETTEQRRARSAGRKTEVHYQPATAFHEPH